MRMQSAASAKANKFHGSARMKPEEGTHIRTIYDLLVANKGLPLDVPLTQLAKYKAGWNGRVLDDLRDHYGLDIRKLAHRRWVLAGEWFGSTYVDYIADRLREADRKGAA